VNSIASKPRSHEEHEERTKIFVGRDDSAGIAKRRSRMNPIGNRKHHGDLETFRAFVV